MRSGFGELERPAQAAKKQLVLSQPDVGEFLRSLGKSSRDFAIRVMLLTGARCNEVCRLRGANLISTRLCGRCPVAGGRTSSQAG